MNNYIIKTMTFILFLSICILIFLSGFWFNDFKEMYIEYNSQNIDTTNITILADLCSNYNNDIVKEINCVNRYIRNNFKYTLTPDNKILSVKELFELGGDCKDWTNLIKEIVTEMNYTSQIIKVSIDEKTSHVFNLVSSEQGYCLLDQKNIYCGLY